VDTLTPRPVDAAELLALTDRLHPVFRTCFAEAPWYETSAQLDNFPARMARMAARAGCRGHIVEQDGMLAGAAFGWPMPTRLPTETVEDAAVAAAASPTMAAKLISTFMVAKLMVSPDYRRRGIGRRLLDATVAQHGRAWLSTHPQAPAVALYQSAGWRVQFRYEIDGLPLVVYLHE
jgi:GNAT superfamily N-acetyltransferase